MSRTFGMEWEICVPREEALRVVMSTQFRGAAPPEPRRFRANPDGSRFMTWTMPCSDAAAPGAWVLGGDPSMLRDRIPLDHCTEVSTPPMFVGDTRWRIVLAKIGILPGARVTPRCALHVHVSATGLSPLMLARVAQVNEDVMREQGIEVPAVRERFARPVPREVIDLASRADLSEDDLWRAWYGTGAIPPLGAVHRHRSRHRVVNLHSVRYRGTIEFRWPSMSLNMERVSAISRQCMNIVQMAEAAC